MFSMAHYFPYGRRAPLFIDLFRLDSGEDIYETWSIIVFGEKQE